MVQATPPRSTRVERIPYYIEQAVRTSIYGRPGPVYLDLPGDIISGKCDDERGRAMAAPARAPTRRARSPIPRPWRPRSRR